MNAKYILLSSVMIGAIESGAQSYLDAMRFNKCDYEGTARSQAMGSAFGALGADLTSQSINPAGLAAYRATEVVFGMGMNFNNSTSNYYGFESEDDKIAVPLNVLGISFNIANTLRENASGVLNQTFSISYSRLADYNKNAVYTGLYGYNSMLDFFCDDMNAGDEFSDELAYRAGWIKDPYEDSENTIDFRSNMWEKPFGKGQLDLSARAEKLDDGWGDGLIDLTQRVKQRGYKGETSFGYALNISNTVYAGASVGIQSLSFREKVEHYEENYAKLENGAAPNFTYKTDLKQEGTGINFNIGAIYTPIQALRIGFALHSPTFYSIEERYRTFINGAFDDYLYSSAEGEYEYRYRVPGKIVASIGGIIGRFGIISLDYERSDYGKSKFKGMDGASESNYDGSTASAKNALCATNTLRMGAEGRITDKFYMRMGYNVQSDPYKKDILISEFKNYAITGGLGFRSNNFYVDASYTCRKTQSERWVLPDADIYSITEYDPLGNEPAIDKMTCHKVTVTFGLRF